MSLANEMSQGIGGLKFVATSPPGEGRLIRIPFYQETQQSIGFDSMVPGAADATAGGATGTASTQSPVILVSAPNAVNTTPSTVLKTPQVSWATLRIVGFEVSKVQGELSGTTVLQKPDVIFKNLQIGGGANLFVHEDYAPSGLYAASNDAFAGLRDYPILKSPNQAEVTMGIKTGVASGTTTFTQNNASVACSILVSCNLVCEILQDDNYGAGVPGPYARQMAMRR